MLYNTFMNEMSITESIIHYLHYHRGITFDVKTFHDYYFKDTNYDSFRKIISRLAKQGEITHLGLTLYYNGEIGEKDIRQTVLDYFIEDRHGFYRGDILLYKLKIIDKKPEVYEINCNVERGITCCRIKVMPFGKRGVPKRGSMLDFYCLCELARIESQVDDDHYDKLISSMSELAKYLKVGYAAFGKIAFGIEALFPRYVYFKIANFLQSFDLYDEVIEWYESLQKRETGKDI